MRFIRWDELHRCVYKLAADLGLEAIKEDPSVPRFWTQNTGGFRSYMFHDGNTGAVFHTLWGVRFWDHPAARLQTATLVLIEAIHEHNKAIGWIDRRRVETLYVSFTERLDAG